MRVALINPRWTFDGSIYFGCHDPHLPLDEPEVAHDRVEILCAGGQGVDVIGIHQRLTPVVQLE